MLSCQLRQNTDQQLLVAVRAKVFVAQFIYAPAGCDQDGWATLRVSDVPMVCASGGLNFFCGWQSAAAPGLALTVRRKAYSGGPAYNNVLVLFMDNLHAPIAHRAADEQLKAIAFSIRGLRHLRNPFHAIRLVLRRQPVRNERA